MKHYTKKPVTIEAVQFTGGAENATPIIDWVLENGGTASWMEEHADASETIFNGDWVPEQITIRTLEGTFHAPVGWWIIRGIKGEFYACEPEIFEGSYDEGAQDDVLRPHRHAAWERGYASGHSNAMRSMSGEPNVPTTPNPFQEPQDASEQPEQPLTFEGYRFDIEEPLWGGDVTLMNTVEVLQREHAMGMQDLLLLRQAVEWNQVIREEETDTYDLDAVRKILERGSVEIPKDKS